MPARRLSVNADDFGFTEDVNRGIVEAHLNGILTSTTLMANGRCFGSAVRLALDHPSLDIGVHFVLVGGHSVARPSHPLPATVPQLLAALALRRIDPYDELSAQMDKILQAGIAPTHLDTHKHTHLHPAVLDALCRLAERHSIRWIRRPFDLPIPTGPAPVPWSKRAVSRGLSSVRGLFHSKMARHGCSATDHFAGFQLTGRFTHLDVIHLLRRLPEGWTEFMVHPGFCTDELRAARTRLKESREAELRALTHPEVRAAVDEFGVVLAPYK